VLPFIHEDGRVRRAQALWGSSQQGHFGGIVQPELGGGPLSGRAGLSHPLGAVQRDRGQPGEQLVQLVVNHPAPVP
jgi:hypothetical protein